MYTQYQIRLAALAALLALLAAFMPAGTLAVTTAVTRHTRAADFTKGRTNGTVIDSEGTISLAAVTHPIELGPLLRHVWTINSLVADSHGAVYIGTSPNGDIIRYANGAAAVIYTGAPDDDDSHTAEPFANEHVFAMALDSQNRLLAGISGGNCRLIRVCGDGVETLFSDPDAAYIFAIATDRDDNIYLGTGPNGLVFRIAPGQDPRRVYKARDNSILSLALADDGTLYAGSDQRGIVYKIDPATGSAAVLYHADQNEITALLINPDGSLYAAATSAQTVKEQIQAAGIAAAEAAGRPDSRPRPAPRTDDEPADLEIANTGDVLDAKKTPPAPETPKGTLPRTAGRIYRIDPRGFVTPVFSEVAVFYALARKHDRLLLATGNDGRLFALDPETEEKSVAYEDKRSAQITSLAIVDGGVYIGCANPPQLIMIEDARLRRGTYESALIDAGQPAKWGALQIAARIPRGCTVSMSARTGNIGEPNDPAFSPWSDPVELTAATQLDVPNARFLQYRLALETTRPSETPLVREVAVAHVIPNLPPRITSVRVSRLPDRNRPGVFVVAFTAEDDNKDTLTYKLEFRRVGRSRWILLKDELTAPKFEWDTRTVADGRYEIRVTADDSLSNSPADAMTGSRISSIFVVDNTPPEIEDLSVDVCGRTAMLNLVIRDEYTAIGGVHYTLNSNERWTAALPDDGVYDTTRETVTIRIPDLEPGEHVIALRIADDVQNTVYRTIDLTVE